MTTFIEFGQPTDPMPVTPLTVSAAIPDFLKILRGRIAPHPEELRGRPQAVRAAPRRPACESHHRPGDPDIVTVGLAVLARSPLGP